MPTMQELQDVMGKQEFLSLPTEVKAQFVNESLGSLFGEQYTTLAPDKQQRMVEFTMKEGRPKGGVEQALEYVPLLAPAIKQYVYGREVQASPRVEQIVGPEISRDWGAALTIAEDLILIGASWYTLGALAPALRAATTLGGIALREGTLGGLYEVGKFVTTPPRSAEEAAVRLGVGAVSGAIIGTPIELGIGAIRNARIEHRWVSAFGNKEAADAFTTKMQNKAIDQITADEISKMFAVAGDSNAEWAQTLRKQAEALTTTKQALQEQNVLRETQAAQEASIQRSLEENLTPERRKVFAQNWRQGFETRAAQRAEGIEEGIAAHAVELENLSQAQAQLDALRAREAQRLAQQEQELQAKLDQALPTERKKVFSQAWREGLEERSAALRERQTQRFVAEEQRLMQRTAELSQQEEILRQASVNKDLTALRSPVGKPLTRSEAMLSEMIRDPNAGTAGFVGTEPVTLPMGMIFDSPEGGVPVIVEKFNASQGILRGGKGTVNRTLLHEPRNAAEQSLLDAALVKNGVGGIPNRIESQAILQNRVAAEQAVLRADGHAARPDFASNPAAQEQSFNLRREAAERLLAATNKEFSPEVTQQLRDIPVLTGKRIVGSLENFPLRDLNDTAHALRGAGFENVHISMGPNGRGNIVFTQSDTPAAQQAASLAIRNATHRGIFDATQGTYSNLTAPEHATLGQAFGITDKARKFETFMQQTLEEMNSRGIRVPATHETLGVRPLEEQVLGRSKKADAIRPEAVAEAEAQQLYNVGDFIRFPVKDPNLKSLWEVVDIAGSQVDDTRHILLQSTDPAVASAGPLQFTPEALRAAGAVRATNLTLGRDPVNYSLANSLEAMLHPELRSPPLVPIENSISAVERAGRAEGFSVNTNRRTGDITLTQGPVRFEFQGLTSIDDAARFLNSLREWTHGERTLLDAFGGIDCLR